jgi:hypothetical protein
VLHAATLPDPNKKGSIDNLDATFEKIDADTFVAGSREGAALPLAMHHRGTPDSIPAPLI